MMYSKKLIELDDMISEIELMQDRAYTMTSILDQNYFDLTDNDMKILMFDNASVEHDILTDYVVKNVNLLKEVRALLREGRRQPHAENDSCTGRSV